MRTSQRNRTPKTLSFDLPRYAEIALVLQGGGALGSYQAGVYEGLAEVGVHPSWIAGISIGALNTAIIAGNAPEDRVQALREFWNTICQPADSFGAWAAYAAASLGYADHARKWASMWSASRTLTEGQQGFFTPRVPLPIAGFDKRKPNEVSFYDTSALRKTLLDYADFDRINNGDVRVSVGAVNVRKGNLVYFDNTKMCLEPEHFMASGALPPGFPAVEIDGEYYWDGGLVSNTPLTEIIEDNQHKDTLVFQVDLWSARGNLPGDFPDVSERTKDIQFSSRTRAITNMLSAKQKHKRLLKEMIELLPADIARNHPHVREAMDLADGGAINIVHLIYNNKFYEGHYKDYEFSFDTLGEHWCSGLEDIRRSFTHADWFDVPSRELGFATHDIHRHATPPGAQTPGEQAADDQAADNQAAVSQPMDDDGAAGTGGLAADQLLPR
ncbi:NTE family protein [Pararobbsia alpina]|uniref:DUF3734 domain-containing protein n=1 Tax=Pararobbsia alpina TaxID=621374 RepID=UPI0039A45C2D